MLSFIELGGDADAVFRGSGVALQTVLSQTPLPCRVIADLFDRLARAAPAGFGIACGRSIRLQYLGLFGFHLSNSDTIGALLADWARYSVIIGYPLQSELTITGPRWSMTFGPRYPMSAEAFAFCVDSTLAGFTQSLFNMTGRRIALDEIGFPFPAPADAAPYDAIDARRILFGVATAFVSGRTEDLDVPIATADPEARDVGAAYCREGMADLGAVDRFADRVATVIRAIGSPFPDEHCVSRHLGVSIRTMQRTLAAEGLTFHRLIDDLRRDRAMLLLEQGQPNKIIAHELGYGDVASFFRAFKRWTGNRPGAWRET